MRQRAERGTEASLYHRRLWAEELRWLSVPPPEALLRVTAQTRYRQKAQAAVVRPGPGGAELLFDQPQRAMTPGQAVVFYQDDLVLGAGTIRSVS